MVKQSNADIKALIKRKRGQMLVHSYLYYKLDTPIISDDLWQEWAEELAKLQKIYPKCCKLKYYDKEFSDWDGTTGMHLPSDGSIEARAKQLLKYNEEINNGQD